MDYIDSCVFLAVIFREDEEERCREYLGRIGYRRHPGGVISHPVLGEIFAALLLKLPPEEAIEHGRSAIRLLTGLLRDRDLTIWRGITDRIVELQRCDYRLSDDDAVQLTLAVHAGCSRFVTIDRLLLGSEQLHELLRRDFGLKIATP
jgi:predicted nucleic acid-binding protein